MANSVSHVHTCAVDRDHELGVEFFQHRTQHPQRRINTLVVTGDSRSEELDILEQAIAAGLNGLTSEAVMWARRLTQLDQPTMTRQAVFVMTFHYDRQPCAVPHNRDRFTVLLRRGFIEQIPDSRSSGRSHLSPHR